MSEERYIEVYRQHRESQRQYVYFLLAAAAAAIAFSVDQTKTAVLSWAHTPLAVGVVCWGGSFFCGCRHLVYLQSNLYANFELLRVQQGQHPVAGRHPDMIQAASEGIMEAIEGNSKVSERYARYQFRLLIAGAVCFIIWHIIQICLRAPQI